MTSTVKTEFMIKYLLVNIYQPGDNTSKINRILVYFVCKYKEYFSILFTF